MIALNEDVIPDGVFCFNCEERNIQSIKQWLNGVSKSSNSMPLFVQDLLTSELNRCFPSTPTHEPSVYAVTTCKPGETTDVEIDNTFGKLVACWCFGSKFVIELTNGTKRHELCTVENGNLCVVLQGTARSDWRLLVTPVTVNAASLKPVVALLGLK